MKKVAIVQSNYIPWKGYFDLINSVDEFILYDDAQYTKRDWRNRNIIKTKAGLKWLTIPVDTKGKQLQKIKDTVINDKQWNKKHWSVLRHNYSRAQCFREVSGFLESLYMSRHEKTLSAVNAAFITAVCDFLGIETKITWSMDYELADGKTEKLVSLCRQARATEYLSGPSAKGYIDEALFSGAGIALSYMDYSGYPEYAQLYPPFEHAVSILDLIFNEGTDAAKYMKTF